jgi:hypothetical protein
MVLKHFPLTADALGAKRWKVAPAAVLDARLEALKAGLRALSGGPADAQVVEKPGFDAALTETYCRKIAAFGREVSYLSALWLDARDLSRLKLDESGAAALVAIKTRYDERSKRAAEELEGLREAVAEARSQGKFRASACAGTE